MIAEKAFERLLGLNECWEVVAAEYEEEGDGRFLIFVRETPKLWPSLKCPDAKCGSDGITCYDHAPVRTWRHSDAFGKKSEVLCEPPRVSCPLCRSVFRIPLPWEGESKHFRKDFELEDMDLKHLATGQAYQIRLELQSIYNSRTEDKARERWQDFLGWVRRKADPFGTLLEPMRKLAGTIETNLEGILAHWKAGLTTGFMEGLNSVFSAVRRKARGYRNSVYMITMLYFVARKLSILSTFTHSK